jgi:hypothetical protein
MFSTLRPRFAVPAFIAALIALALPAAASAAPEFPLNIEEPGTGTGTVLCKVEAQPAEECKYEYPEGTELVLIAEAEEGSKFVAWEGECDSIAGNECELKMDAEKTAKVLFEEEETFVLTVEEAGGGWGTVLCKVEAQPAEECEYEYPEGTELSLIATADPESEFLEWGEDCTGSGSCELTMDEAHAVTATFEPEPPPDFALNVEEPGTGSGTVECEAETGPEECAAEYPEGTELALIATADLGSKFVEWTGACEVTMSAAKSVGAKFDLIPRTLTITKAGSGSGSVACNGTSCASTYANGTKVTLAASAASGSTFAGFSGGGCSGTGNCVVTIEADTTVTATFTANPAPTPTPTPTPTPEPEGKAKAAGSASVKSGKAELKLTCSGGPCKGTLQLTAKLKQGKKTKNAVIGKASFSLADGASTTLKVKLSSQAKQLLKSGKALGEST